MIYIAHAYCFIDEDATEYIHFFTSLEEAQQFKQTEEEMTHGDFFVNIYEAKRIM